jgi:phospholipid/cholesterol/gamma-HCH transport system substrate-binding protein
MPRRQYHLLVGLFAVGAVIVLGYMILQFGRGGMRKYGDMITVRAQFNQAGRLIENAPVYLSGVEIGYVQKVEVTATGKVVVSMQVASDAGLRMADVPEIAQTGVLGDVIVNFIRRAEPGPIARDGTLFVGKDPVDLVRQAEIFVDLLTSEETVSTVRRILDNVEALTGEETRTLLNDSLENIHELTKQLREDVETLRTVFTPEVRADIQAIIANARTASEDLPEIMREGRLILRETRVHLIELAENLTRNARRFDSIIESVETILATTARGEGTVGRLVNDPEMYESTVKALDELREAVVAIKYNLPLGIGRRIRAEEEEAAAEAARADQIWRR